MLLDRKAPGALVVILVLAGSARAQTPNVFELENRVRNAIFDDARIRSYALIVEVDDGVAILRGVVGSDAAREAAVESALGIEGIRDVRNGLIVKPDAELTDPEIELYVDQALSRDRGVDSHEIVVTVLDGEVELHGTVDSEEEKERAERVAGRVLGVKDVENELTLSPYAQAEWTDDDELARAVRETLASYEDVTVHVDRGVVILRGTVASREERERTEDLAFEAGASLVKNLLEVRRSR